MFTAVTREVKRRQKNLNPHFSLSYLSEEARQVLGFLGEFACAAYFGIDWKNHIRVSYDLADQYDLILKDKIDSSIDYKIDVKTETIPKKEILVKILNKIIDDDEPYGRRLICEFQFENNLSNYDWVVFGAFLRPQGEKNWSPVGKRWYFLGGVEAKTILQTYKVTEFTPFGRKYPEPCVNVCTSSLLLRRIIR